VYGVPFDWLEKYGVRRYGFHGSSHRYVSCRAPQVLGRSAEDLRLVSCHLGGTSSICAIRNGKSVDTSLGFSPQSGLEHATRSGELDPFVVLYVMEKEGLSPNQISALLCKKSGLLGISGVCSDVRDLEQAAAQGQHRAALALDVFVYEIKKFIGAYAGAMGGLDAVAFAGGIGENSCRVRAGVCQGMEFLGLWLDPAKNQAVGAEDRVISPSDSPVGIAVIFTNEELMVAQETVRVLAESQVS
jgi:acetate kinase